MAYDCDGPNQRIEALQARISSLCSAILRISASLDIETVLQEIVDSARTLTHGAFGALITIDEAGHPTKFFSSGMTSDMHRRFNEWTEGLPLFAHLRDQSGPLRVGNVAKYIRSLGFSAGALPFKTAQGAQIHHRGTHVGSLFVVQQEGGLEFTEADEQLLELFASQAATAMANARAYRDEQRARAKLEVLVDTSPVGVVVFDAPTGRFAPVNRQAERMVESLRLPGHPEQLLEELTFIRADGREIALTDEMLSSAETVRHEEVLLSVPDGQSLRTLINATPVHSPEGEVESVVVTMQDLAPLEELERQRTEFLAIVSHELRTPLTSIKGSAATVLGASPGFAPAEMLQFFRIIDGQAERMSGLIGDLLDAGRIATGTLSVSTQASDVAALVDRARNTFVNGGGRHTVAVDLPSDLPQVSADQERIIQVLNNLLANAAQHSPDSSPIKVTTRRDGSHVAISVTDRGKGIPPDRLPHLFRKSTGVGLGELGLRGGLGLAICKGLVEAHGGRIWAASEGEGRGARFTFTVPVAGEDDGEPGGVRSAYGRRAPRGPARKRTRILVVDDDPETLRYVRDVLTAAGCTTLVTGDHRRLSRLIRIEKPDLVLLDLMLPRTDGIQLLKDVPELADRPVIFISAYGRDETIARALGAGAVDYIVKPFSPTELTARVRAVLRNQAEPEPFELEDLAIEYERRRVTVAGRHVKLTATEYEVLRLLSLNAGRVSTYRSLLRQAWSRHDGTFKPKLVHALVKRLRSKLGEGGASTAYILNERGVGYRMTAPRENEE